MATDDWLPIADRSEEPANPLTATGGRRLPTKLLVDGAMNLSEEVEQDPESTVRLVPLAELAAVLPGVLAGVSPTRASIITEQLRGAIQNDPSSDLIVLATTITPRAFVVLQHSATRDDATMIHAGWWTGSAETGSKSGSESGDDGAAAGMLGAAIDVVCRHRSIDFIQWATDPVNDSNSTRSWPSRLRFQCLGTLEYLARDLQSDPAATEIVEAEPLVWSSVDLDQTDEMSRFERVVARTYENSKDCPGFEKLRTPQQILEGYRKVDSFDSNGWFTIHATAGGPAVGCVILARHEAGEVVELTYMGVLPESRGQGYGDLIFRQTIRRCQNHGVRRLLLAVDRSNTFAATTYELGGMRPLMSETVWGRAGRSPD